MWHAGAPVHLLRYRWDVFWVNIITLYAVFCLQRSSAAQPSLLQKLPGGVSVAAPKQNVAVGQAAVFAGLGTWALIQVC
jgi:hypothetical protein